MKVKLRCFSTMVKPERCDYKHNTAYDMAEGQTVADLYERAGISKKDVKLAFVNHRVVDHDTVLYNGDHVGLSPAVGGM